MKFKIIFLLFNILILFSFLMIFLMPVFMLGGDYAMQFWRDSWYVALVFIIILVFINILYFMNRKILGYLEAENWADLKKLLERKLFSENRTGKMYVRMYISTCIATSSLDDISLLERKLRKDAPEVLKRWALQLGLPHLLSNDAEKMKAYFGEFLDAKGPESGWIRWNYAFALLMQKETDEAAGLLTGLVKSEKDPLLRVSSLYMLSPFKGEGEIGSLVDDGRTALRASLTRDGFAKELAKRKDNVQTLFLAKIFDEAIEWLYSNEAGEQQ